jgi:hypothetical protein
MVVKNFVVRYVVKPEFADENQRLIKRVFERLAETRPAGLRYTSLLLADGVSFVHVLSVETEDGQNPLSSLPEFAEFTKDIKDRCDEPPVAQEATVVGAFGFFGA